MDELLKIIKSPNTWISLIVVIIAVVICFVIKALQKRIEKNDKLFKKAGHEVRLFNNILRYAVLVVAVIIVLDINGVNVTSIITSLGVVTIVVGFALQDFLNDVVTGVNIALDRYFKIGDVITYEGEDWEVMDMSLKATKLRNLDSNGMYTVANRNFTKVEVLSEYQDIIVPGDYAVPHDKMVKVIEEITKDVMSDKRIKKCDFIGTESFDASQISYKIRVYQDPLMRHKVKHFVLSRIQDILAENDISIPFNQLDVHVKNN